MTRETLLPKLAAHVIEHGLGSASLRPLAKAAGTSDRMLLYHFGNKERLIVDLLRYIAGLYSAALGARDGTDRAASRRECAARILSQTRLPAMQGFTALWWEIVAGAARGLPGYREAGEAIMATQLEWLETQMPADDPDPVAGARYLLTLIEGSLMLSAIGHARTARAGLIEALLASEPPPD